MTGLLVLGALAALAAVTRSRGSLSGQASPAPAAAAARPLTADEYAIASHFPSVQLHGVGSMIEGDDARKYGAEIMATTNKLTGQAVGAASGIPGAGTILGALGAISGAGIGDQLGRGWDALFGTGPSHRVRELHETNIAIMDVGQQLNPIRTAVTFDTLAFEVDRIAPGNPQRATIVSIIFPSDDTMRRWFPEVVAKGLTLANGPLTIQTYALQQLGLRATGELFERAAHVVIDEGGQVQARVQAGVAAGLLGGVDTDVANLVHEKFAQLLELDAAREQAAAGDPVAAAFVAKFNAWLAAAIAQAAAAADAARAEATAAAAYNAAYNAPVIDIGGGGD